MIQKLVDNMMASQQKMNMIEKNQEKLYQYGYRLLIELILNILAAVVIAVCFHSYLWVFCFLLFFIPLRSFAGGYHAEKSLSCILLSAVILTSVSIITIRYGSDWNFILYNVCETACSIIIWNWAPVENHNKPFREEEFNIFRKKTRFIYVVQFLVGNMLCIMGNTELVFVIVQSHLVMSAALLLGKWQNKKR